MEIWKKLSIDGYECYEVSNMGNVRKKVKTYLDKENTMCLEKTFIVKQYDNSGYKQVTLTKGTTDSQITIAVHILVAVEFCGHVRNGRYQHVDHIDGDKSNNKATNLRSIPNRLNTAIGQKRSSKYVGITKSGKKWVARIEFDGKRTNLGAFDNEYDAHLAYQEALAIVLQKREQQTKNKDQ